MPQVCVYYLFKDPHLFRSIYQSLFYFIIHLQKCPVEEGSYNNYKCRWLLCDLQCWHNYERYRTEGDIDKEHSCMHLTASYMMLMLCWGLPFILYDSTYCGTTDQQQYVLYMSLFFFAVISSSYRKSSSMGFNFTCVFYQYTESCCTSKMASNYIMLHHLCCVTSTTTYRIL